MRKDKSANAGSSAVAKGQERFTCVSHGGLLSGLLSLRDEAEGLVGESVVVVVIVKMYGEEWETYICATGDMGTVR
jgi:hypothetical protein